ncbi:hypothetical protein [Flavobacterium sp.]|uniref:hypothetical protein n=1 Tax=Flavobacterium sp. TaxID=239 RepID=UPI003752A987
MIKTYLLLLLLFSISSSYAQQEIINESDLDPKVVLYIAPLSLIDFFDGPSIRYGTDIKLQNKLSFSLEAGNYLPSNQSVKINSSGYLIKPEIKFRILENKYNTQYLGIEYQYKQQSYDFKDSISINDGPNFEKQYSMKRKMNCISLKYSFVEELGEKFTFTYYFGLGIRFLKSSNNLSQEENDGILDDEFHGGTQVESLIRPIGTINTVNISIGIKFGYILF